MISKPTMKLERITFITGSQTLPQALWFQINLQQQRCWVCWRNEHHVAATAASQPVCSTADLNSSIPKHTLEIVTGFIYSLNGLCRDNTDWEEQCFNSQQSGMVHFKDREWRQCFWISDKTLGLRALVGGDSHVGCLQAKACGYPSINIKSKHHTLSLTEKQ